MKGKQICPFFIKSDPVLRLSDLELFTPCWAETKGKRLSYNLNTMNLQWNKAAWASTIPKCALTFNSKSVWQWMAWKLLPTWWPMFSQISVSLFGFWVGLAIIHGAGAGQTDANRGTNKERHLPKTTQIIRSGARNQSQSPCPFHADMCHCKGTRPVRVFIATEPLLPVHSGSTHRPWRKATCLWVQE